MTFTDAIAPQVPVDNVYGVFVRRRLIDNTNAWIYQPRLEPITWRAQDRGLGSATLRWIDGDDVPPQVWWVVIVDRTRLADPTALSIPDWTSEAAAVQWWGQLRTAPIEQFANGQTNGALEASEFGYYLLGQPVRHSDYHPGYNPRIDGVTYGNRPLGVFDRNVSNPVNGWTVQQVVEDLLATTLDIPMEALWVEPPDFVTQIETWPSYDGQSVMTALDELTNPLGYVFDITTDASSVGVTFYPRSRHPDMDPDYPVDLLTTDYPLAYLDITEHDESYDRVILRGQRVRVTFSPSTYNDSEEVTDLAQLTPAWSEDDEAAFIEGPDPLLTQEELLDAAEEAVAGYDPAAGNANDRRSESTEAEITAWVAGKLTAHREWRRTNYPDVYQRFTWNIGSGDRLTVSHWPGHSGGALADPDAASTSAPGTLARWTAFPRFQFQDPVTEAVHTWPIALDGVDAQPPLGTWDPAPDLGYTMGAEMLQAEPTMYYRTSDAAPHHPDVERSSGYRYPYTLWLDARNAGPGRQVSALEYDGRGVRLESPFPESWASVYNEVWQDIARAGDTPVIQTTFPITMDRDKWLPGGDVGASQRHPFFVQYPDKGHWGRMVFTLSFYTSQRVELVSTIRPNGERVKIIEDPDLQVWFILPGTVTSLEDRNRFYEWRLGSTAAEVREPNLAAPSFWQAPFDANGSVPDWESEDYDRLFFRNTVAEGQKRLRALAAWFGRDRRSMELRTAVFADPVSFAAGAPTVANTLHVGLMVGDVVDPDVDPDISPRVYDVSSAITSIEVDLVSNRRTVVTEVPAAPPMSRFRRLGL